MVSNFKSIFYIFTIFLGLYLFYFVFYFWQGLCLRPEGLLNSYSSWVNEFLLIDLFIDLFFIYWLIFYLFIYIFYLYFFLFFLLFKKNFIRHIKHKKKQSVINNDVYNHYFYVDVNDILQTWKITFKNNIH